MTFMIKICGLSTLDTVDTALDLGAEMIGLMFYPPSPRHLDLATAGALADHARGKTDLVAVTVNADDAMVDEIVGKVRPDWLQLHGKEAPDRVLEIKRRSGCRVMKAIGVSSADDLAAVAEYAPVVDSILFDAKPPKDATRPGGLGTAFDWHLLDSLDVEVPYMLSGGLNAANVADALAITRAPGIDASSGVEREKGVKDPARIADFIASARAAAKKLGLASTDA